MSDENAEKFRPEKRARRLTFWVRRPPGGVGVFHSKGWWPKTSCPPSKVCLPWVSKGGIWDVPGFLSGCPGPLGVFKKFVKKVRAHFSVPRSSQNPLSFIPLPLCKNKGACASALPSSNPRKGPATLKSNDHISKTVKNTPKMCLQARPWRTEIAAIFAICDCDAHRGPQKSRDFRDKRKQCCIAI